MSTVKWIENWFKSQCDGGWEHSYVIRIESIDNPGWSVSIDIAETELESLSIPYQLNEVSENDWYGIRVENKVFEAFGDTSKLEFLLEEFRRLAEENFTIDTR